MKQLNAYKKSLMVLAFSFFAVTGALAQIEKGAWLFSGGSNLGNTSVSPTGGSSSSVFNVDLKGGYFFMDNLAGGVLFNLLSTSGNSVTGIGVFARYYLQGKFFLGAGFQSLSAGSGPSTTQIPLEAGYAFFLGNAVAVEPALRYTTYDGGSTLNIGVGFSVYLGRD